MSNQPIRIAHIVGKMVGGGVESTVMNYYRNIDKTRYQYDFLVDSDSTKIPEEIEQLGGKVIPIPPYQKLFKYQKELRKLLAENEYKIVYSHLNTLSVFPLFAAWRAKTPIRIAHNHSTAGKGELKKNVLKYVLRLAAKWFPTNLCACSEYAGRWLFGKRTMETGGVTIWKNAVEVDKFLFSKDIRDEIRENMGIKNKFVVGHVGRFIHQKNHMFLIDIFNKIYQQSKDAVLLLIGTGELMDEVRRKVAALHLNEAVIFLGNSDKVSSLYQAMDVFVFPSFYEGLGMVAVEAQIAGLPVLAADTVPIEAKICSNFKYLSLNNSSSEWASEILNIKLSERSNMYQIACQAGYEIGVEAKKMMDWYDGLINL